MTRADLAMEPLLGALLGYWETARAGRAMPRRRDIDPLDMPPRLLPHVQLVEIGDRGRLRLRLVGTAIVDALGRDPTGRWLDETFAGEERRFLEQFYGSVLRSRRPVAGRCWLRKIKGPDLGLAWLATPLSENGDEISMILAAMTFRFARARTLASEDRAAPEETIEVL